MFMLASTTRALVVVLYVVTSALGWIRVRISIMLRMVSDPRWIASLSAHR